MMISCGTTGLVEQLGDCDLDATEVTIKAEERIVHNIERKS